MRLKMKLKNEPKMLSVNNPINFNNSLFSRGPYSKENLLKERLSMHLIFLM